MARRINLKETEALTNFKNAMEKFIKAKSFAQIQKFAILMNFGNNEDLCEKILVIQFFK